MNKEQHDELMKLQIEHAGKRLADRMKVQTANVRGLNDFLLKSAPKPELRPPSKAQKDRADE